jgi:hypothetical protein
MAFRWPPATPNLMINTASILGLMLIVALTPCSSAVYFLDKLQEGTRPHG